MISTVELLAYEPPNMGPTNWKFSNEDLDAEIKGSDIAEFIFQAQQVSAHDQVHVGGPQRPRSRSVIDWPKLLCPRCGNRVGFEFEVSARLVRYDIPNGWVGLPGEPSLPFNSRVKCLKCGIEGRWNARQRIECRVRDPDKREDEQAWIGEEEE